MLSSLRPSAQQFLLNVARVNYRMERAQARISTGLRITKASDDPDQIATLLTARAYLEAARQIQFNLGRVKGEVDSAEQTLQQGVRMFERIRTLGAQGLTGTQTAETRAMLAGEIGSILEQMVGVAGTVVEGRFIFSGDADQTAPYTIDLTLADPFSPYQGSPATRLAQHPNGTTFAVAHTAEEIFDSVDPATNVFDATNALKLALEANDETAIRTAVEGLVVAGTHLNSEVAFYGTRQNKIAEALEFGQMFQTRMEAQISSLQDADVTEAIVDLQQGQTQQQATLASWAQMPRTTLFDFLG